MQKVIRRRSPNGFTLVELVIVMLILVALAGIMVPLFGGFTDRAHNSAASANISELVKQLELFNAKTQKGYPDQLDNLASGGAVWAQTGGNTVGISPAAATLMQTHTLTAKEASSFTVMGINNVTDASKNTDNATFHVFALPPASSSDVVPVTTGLVVATPNFTALAAANAIEQLGLPNADPTNFVYVMLGIGQSNTAVGNAMAAAPVHYDTIDPAVFYQRYVAIFQIPIDSNPNAGAPAKLVGVIGVHDAGFAGLDEHIKDYNLDVNSGN